MNFFIPAAGGGKKHFLLPSAVRYVSDLWRMPDKRPVRRDMFQVSLRLLPQTLLSKAVISGPLCCFLPDTRLRRGVDAGGKMGGRETTISPFACQANSTTHRSPNSL